MGHASLGSTSDRCSRCHDGAASGAHVRNSMDSGFAANNTQYSHAFFSICLKKIFFRDLIMSYSYQSIESKRCPTAVVLGATAVLSVSVGPNLSSSRSLFKLEGALTGDASSTASSQCYPALLGHFLARASFASRAERLRRVRPAQCFARLGQTKHLERATRSRCCFCVCVTIDAGATSRAFALWLRYCAPAVRLYCSAVRPL